MDLLTSGDIANRLTAEGIDANRDRVAYALRKGNIQAMGRAGIVRLFPESAVFAVKMFLESRRVKRPPEGDSLCSQTRK